MTYVLKRIAIILAVSLAFDISLYIESSYSQLIEDDPSQLRDIDVEEHLDENIPLDLAFIDDRGDSVALGEYFHKGKPIILMMEL